MSNVLSEEKKQQVIALGRLGWTLRRIEQATGVRRETAGADLKAAGIAIRPGGWGQRAPAKLANEVTTDSSDSKPANDDSKNLGIVIATQPLCLLPLANLINQSTLVDSRTPRLGYGRPRSMTISRVEEKRQQV
jgi:hypothetical protein